MQIVPLAPLFWPERVMAFQTYIFDLLKGVLPQSPIKPSVKLNNKLYPNVIRSSEGFARARRRGVTIIGARVRGRKNVVFTAWHESVKTASIHSEAFWKSTTPSKREDAL